MVTDNLIGRQLANYRIDKLLGKGGMAEVYYGWDVKLHRPVAIKVIAPQYRDDEDYAQRFISEARAVATWKHENIIQVYYAGEEDNLYYFAMEHVEGKSLGDLLSECSAENVLLPKGQVLHIGSAIAAALDYAHKRGVIHRDIKPANVLIEKDGRVVLTDFGLALFTDKGSKGEVLGTAHYIAPEQARSSADAVPQSDLYSLGVLLYEMLTGVVPFDDPSPTSVLMQHLTQPPPSPCFLNPELNKQIEQVLLKALSKQPQERFQTGQELMDALEQAIKGEPLVDEQTQEAQIELPPPPPVSPPRQQESQAEIEDPLVGKQLDEFRIEALIGRGGMGRVYRAFDVRLERDVAIKIIDPSYRNRPDYFSRFEREAKAIASLEHLNIVQLYHYRETNQVLYMALQYVEGVTLGATLEKHHQQGDWIDPNDVLQYISEICSALDYMHSQGVIHRDLKPSNIILSKEGHVVITDFGLALLSDFGTKGKIFGSPRYIAPEQAISSAQAVPQSDLYSVGVILYEMLTGRLPFDSDDPMELAMQHMDEPPPSPREIRPEINPELEQVILKSLAKAPADRYQDGAALTQALTRALRTASLAKPESTRTDIQIPQTRRYLWPAIGIALVAILITTLWILSGKFGNNWFSSGDGAQAVNILTATSTKPLVAQSSPDTQMPEIAIGVTDTPLLPSPTFTSSPTRTFTPTNTLPPTPTPNVRTIRTEDQMPMMLIPAGKFMMGAANDDPDAEFDERPQHEVYLDSFYMDQYEVSVSQYAAFLNILKKHWGSACLSSACALTKVEITESHLAWDGRTSYQPEAGYEDYPMNSVTWYGAQAYCEWVGASLPTEAEWEYAARGWDGRLYPWGNEPPDENRAVFEQPDYTSVQPVNSLINGASFFGVLHMAGNVIEWVGDTYFEDYYYIFGNLNLNPAGPPGHYRSLRVLRGGSWKDLITELRASARQGAEPLLFEQFGYDVGFRCVRPISNASPP